ncbi:MFS transporter [SAR92 clade bacterium H231]|nr:MFS transporter [SAR92 clade bacterium H231]
MMSSNPLDLRQALNYAMPATAIYFLFGPLLILQGIYSKYFGLALTSIAAVLFFANLLDAVTDPVVGYISDRYYRRTGKRKPFIVLGSLLFLLSTYFLYIPPENVTTIYFLSWFVAVYLALKLFDIPHLAWPNELTQCPRGRNQLYGLRSFMMFAGSLMFYALPQLPFFDTTEITPQTLKWSFFLAAVLLIPTLFSCIKWMPDGVRVDGHCIQNQAVEFSLLKIILTNKPLLVFLLAVFLSGSGVGMWASLNFIYIDAYLGLGDKFSLIYVISLASSMFALGVWYKTANRIGNIKTWMLGVSMMAMGIFCIGMLTPGSQEFIPLLLIMVFLNVGIASNNIMAPSLLSHIVDYGSWKFGADHAATYFSIFTMVTKVNLAIGSAIGLGIVGWYGFEPSSTSGQSDDAIFGLRIAITWIPVCIVATSIMIIAFIPICTRRHSIILKRLKKRRDSLTEITTL